MANFSNPVNRIVRRLTKMMNQLEKEEKNLEALGDQWKETERKATANAKACHSEAERAYKIRKNIGALIEEPTNSD